MGYIVRYGEPSALEKQAYKKGKLRMIIPVCVLFLIISLYLFYPEAVHTIRRVLIPGEDEATIAAFHAFLDAARQGESVSECITVFCEEVFHGLG